MELSLAPRSARRVTPNTSLQSSDELGHRPLVNECRSVFNACGILLSGLVQTAPEPDVFGVFL